MRICIDLESFSFSPFHGTFSFINCVLTNVKFNYMSKASTPDIAPFFCKTNLDLGMEQRNNMMQE